jgi:hypothetical protein
MMGANLIGFVLGMDGAQYFVHELVSSWAGKSRFRGAFARFANRHAKPRYTFPPRRLSLSFRWRTADVRIPVCSIVYEHG